MSKEDIKAQLNHTLSEIDVPVLGTKIAGKVRDSYVLGNKRVLVTSDRLSAFDKILTTLPFKGQVLNAMAIHWFESTKHIIDNHLISSPHPNVLIGTQLEIIPIEVVVRGYLAGSAWRDYQAGKAVSGVSLPKGLRKSQKFETPILTPSTKAEQGEHDEPISEKEIASRGIVSESLWSEISAKAIELFNFGSAEAAKRGLILVDTKYEMGLRTEPDGSKTLVLADEIHTADSSRYWLQESYQSRFEAGEDPEMLDKEFIRRWLIAEGYMGDGQPPEFSDDFRIEAAERYIEVCELITGKPFIATPGEAKPAIESVLQKIASEQVV
ncbi:UNVERIFIED_CONTAM: hypothetical protein GTU68_056820 [Idotea baltica]|nr:hypothetical protein [Idotea baltica]